MANFGDPRSPVPLSNASISLLRSGHCCYFGKRNVFFFVFLLFGLESVCENASTGVGRMKVERAVPVKDWAEMGVFVVGLCDSRREKLRFFF